MPGAPRASAAGLAVDAHGGIARRAAPSQAVTAVGRPCAGSPRCSRSAPYPVYVAAEPVRSTRSSATGSRSRWCTLGFAVAAMLALGAASWMALRTARSEDAATREWQREAARRETVEKALRESQRMEAIGQLTGGVAHDFNNLLMVVNGNLQILRKRLGTQEHDRQLEAIGDAIGRGATLTRHLLAFSRRQALQPRTHRPPRADARPVRAAVALAAREHPPRLQRRARHVADQGRPGGARARAAEHRGQRARRDARRRHADDQHAQRDRRRPARRSPARCPASSC